MSNDYFHLIFVLKLIFWIEFRNKVISSPKMDDAEMQRNDWALNQLLGKGNTGFCSVFMCCVVEVRVLQLNPVHHFTAEL